MANIGAFEQGLGMTGLGAGLTGMWGLEAPGGLGAFADAADLMLGSVAVRC